MFKVKKTSKPGECRAMRCTSPAQDLLCPRHLEQWEQEGRPALETQTKAPPTGTGLVPAELETELTEERHKAQKALDLIAKLPAETDADRERLGSLINVAAAQVKRLDEKRKEATGPLLKTKKVIDSWFEAPIEFYKQARQLLEDKLGTKLLEIQQAKDKALAEIQANAGSAPAEAFELAHAPSAAPETVGSKFVTKYRVDDFALVPDKYKLMVLDHAAIARQVMETGMNTVIPGIVVYEEVDIRARRAS